MKQRKEGLEQHCPTEVSAMGETFYTCTAQYGNQIARVLEIWLVVTEELKC